MLIKKLFLFASIFLCIDNINSQNCYNSNFENGDLSGYSAYTGGIASDGVITIDNFGANNIQFRVFSVLDGFDPIALEYCTENKFLPLVPPIGGAYALRLGNSFPGARAERVQLKFTVTNETSFFLLRYAVLLNDPGHEPYEQPRFRLSITDVNGDEFPCGRYEVVAAPEIENFETCMGNWRVRPWTNIGIELLSYLGKEIIIDLMTTDCSRGGHAGYAYLDATCQPLQIELLNNCADTSKAIMQVTPGFDKYLWNTGDTTSLITIDGPNAGDVYYVTVTSATGCELVLNDTIPPYDAVIPPILDPSMTSSYCSDTAFWFTPSGTNLQNTYSIQYQSFVDSIVVNTLNHEGYTFIAYSDYGCPLDTVTHYFVGPPKILDSIAHVSCFEGNDGSIHLLPFFQNTDYDFVWSTGDTTSSILDLSAGKYTVTISDATGCSASYKYDIQQPSPMNIYASINDIICANSMGSGYINVSGSGSPFQYSYDLGNTFVSNNFYNAYEQDSNLVLIKNSKGCLDSIFLVFNVVALPVIDAVTIKLDSCGNKDATIIIDNITEGVSPYTFALNNVWFSEDSIFENIKPGLHTLYVKDSNNCVGRFLVTIPEIANFEFQDLFVNSTVCKEANGSIEIVASIVDSVLYSLDNVNFQTTNSFYNLDTGLYTVYIKNKYNCKDSTSFYIEDSYLPDPGFDLVNNFCFGDHNGEITLFNQQSDNPYTYLWSDSSTNNPIMNLPSGNYQVTVVDTDSCVNFFSYEILQPSELLLGLSGQFYTCPDESNAEINLKGKGGTKPYSYSFNGGLSFSPDSTLLDLGFGIYNLVISDDNGCKIDTTIEIFKYDRFDSIDVVIIADTCGLSLGVLEVMDVIGGLPPYDFSLDLINFYSEGFFNNLPHGPYELFIKDGNGCIWVENYEIPYLESVNIDSLDIIGTSCELNNGQIIVHTSNSLDNIYWIGEQTPDTSSLFTNLMPDEYTVFVQNKYGCIDSINFLIDDSRLPLIEAIEVIYDTCANFNNTVDIEVSGGTTPYFYQLNEKEFSESSSFYDTPSGLNFITILDSDNCSITDSFDIEHIDPYLYDITELIMPDCGKNNGVVKIDIIGGVGASIVLFGEEEFSNGFRFEGLEDGTYDFILKDTTNCFYEVSVDLVADCKVYLPNIFSPNGDGLNDKFKVQIPTGSTAWIFKFEIYDRWGEKIYTANDLEIDSDFNFGWDGRLHKKLLLPGIYSYYVDLIFYNGKIFRERGNFTMVR